ncbi:hypothetical protein cypCar_00023248 [Cyprinus carpio]|nr:hypothetical protein cypCar_00023248 [Cyprinus carpio]
MAPPQAPPQAPLQPLPQSPPQALPQVQPQDPPQAPPQALPQVQPQDPPKSPPQALPQVQPKDLSQGTLQEKEPKWPLVERLYGLFQLSDQWACNSDKVPSLNICNMKCTALNGDDATNDIACLKTLMNSMPPKPLVNPSDLKKILGTLLVDECRSVVHSEYFAECF